MRAFLSHSSKNKAYVQAVGDNLRPGHYELDSRTFDEGELNSDAILKALQRCDLFCLFLSEDALNSAYVNFELAFSKELVASGKIDRILVICLDDDIFNKAKGFIRHYNIVRRPRTPESAARLIEGKLISSKDSKNRNSHPFVGREAELKCLEKQANSLEKPRIRALYISGNSGSGRRTVAKKFFQNQYPEVGPVPPSIDLDSFDGYDDIYRAIISSLRPSISMLELRTLIEKFQCATDEAKSEIIADEINKIVHDRETLYVFDGGGVLRENGAFQPEIEAILDKIVSKPHPPLVFISPRMIPSRLRRAADDIAYLSVPALTREESERLILGLLRDSDVVGKLGQLQLEQLIDIADQHPFNIYRMVDRILETSVDLFLSNIRDFTEWKHKQTSEYLRSVNLNELDLKILSVFSIAPELDFSSLSDALSERDSSEISGSIQKMLDLNIVRVEDERISISPVLRIASERDPRTELKGKERTQIMCSLAQSLVLRIQDGEAPIVLLDSAILTILESGKPTTEAIKFFILPSHRVWLAKRHYDARRWKDAIRAAREAIEGEGGTRLSKSGAIAACRYLGLAAARTNDKEMFDFGIQKLRHLAHDEASRAIIHFLKGFYLRLNGDLKEAYKELTLAYELSPNNRATSRELASVCLNLGRSEEAESYAREAYEAAKSNPYIVDIFISCLIRNRKNKCRQDSEIRGLLESLKQLDEEEGRSFYETRLAEIEYLYGDNREALRLVQEALRKTPSLFAPLELCARILLKAGETFQAKEKIDAARKIVMDPRGLDSRANHRPLLQLEVAYHLEICNFDKAIDIYRDKKFFTDSELENLKKEIEMLKAYKMNRYS
ncbi:TIR domain-containing protein [Bombella sp. ESL0387]|nr:TIR domain-containing protein [Bombella sp. ESL0387]